MRRLAPALALLALLTAGCGGPPPDPHAAAVAEQVGLLAHHDASIRAKPAAALAALPPLDGEAVAALAGALRDRDAARDRGPWR